MVKRRALMESITPFLIRHFPYQTFGYLIASVDEPRPSTEYLPTIHYLPMCIAAAASRVGA